MIDPLTRRDLVASAATLPFFGFAGRAVAALPPREDLRLQPVWHADRVWNGVATAPDGRTFAAFPAADQPGIQAAEIARDGTLTPWPDAAWNAVHQPPRVDGAFVCVNALRIGPDGRLWIVDAGATGIGKPAVPGGARLFAYDLAINRQVRVIDLAAGLKPKSYIDDIRFNGAHLYATDAGEPGLLVVRLSDGQVRRVLDGHPLLTDRRPMRADRKRLTEDKGKPVKVHADQLEVSPDGRWLYVQPSSGPLARVPAALLDDPATPPDRLAAAIAPFFDSATTGGTAIDAAGNLYISQPDERRILKVTPAGRATTLIADPRLVWSDAMWIDRDGWLWIPATQLNRTPGMNGGRLAVRYPVWIYRMKIDARPAPNDHV